MIVPVGPQIDTTNDLSLRHEQPSLIITLVPWLAISTLGEAVSIDVGTGPAFFSNYKFGGQNFGSPVQIVGTGFNVIPGVFTEYRLQHFSDAGAYGPYKAGVECISSKSTSDSEHTLAHPILCYQDRTAMSAASGFVVFCGVRLSEDGFSEFRKPQVPLCDHFCDQNRWERIGKNRKR